MKCTINADQVRYACINNNWFTCGNSERYANLLNGIRETGAFPVECLAHQVQAIAGAIAANSDVDECRKTCDLSYREYVDQVIVYTILNDCLTLQLED